jgi:dynein heavy chain 1
VPRVEIEPAKLATADVVIPTVDTVRHEEVVQAWLAARRPLVLCGPPGSGKTMTLLSTLSAQTDSIVVVLSFSSATTPELLLKTFAQYCERVRTHHGVVLRPADSGKWLVVFCDELNLPEADRFGTQRVVSFMRQMLEHGGFWSPADQTWVSLERVQFVGTCNPPTDPGRVPLSHRFLRMAPVLMVDFPAVPSLTQIYGTFARALLKQQPALRALADPLTEACVELYAASQRRFTPDMQPHYIYSPRTCLRVLVCAFLLTAGCSQAS